MKFIVRHPRISNIYLAAGRSTRYHLIWVLTNHTNLSWWLDRDKALLAAEELGVRDPFLVHVREPDIPIHADWSSWERTLRAKLK